LSSQEVILVDEEDRAIGTMEKMEAHRQGALHRAFSIFIFNSRGEMLLQQRADQKYHSPGLWSNACCSHPAPGQDTTAAADRRLMEEMGFHTRLTPLFSFSYSANFDNGLSEAEFDHVFAGRYDGEIRLNPEEVKSFMYKSMSQIEADLATNPESFTAWFKVVFPRIRSWCVAQQISP
jgi:isopentenyl-diphosphate Delta-isomerase